MTLPPNARRNPVSAQGRRLIQEAIRQAAALTALPKGWTSSDAIPVSPEAVRHVAAFIEDAIAEIPDLAAPAVIPTVRGGIQLEWSRRGIEVEVGFDTGGPGSWYAEDRETGTTQEAPVHGHEDAIRRWLSRMSARIGA